MKMTGAPQRATAQSGFRRGGGARTYNQDARNGGEQANAGERQWEGHHGALPAAVMAMVEAIAMQAIMEPQ